MAFYDTSWYCNAGDQSTTGYYAVTKWATGATIAAGALRRQNAAPAVGSERVFVCIVAGTTHATTEPTWVITRGGKTTDNTVTWQECTGASAVNGDLTSTPTWSQARAINTAVTLGAIIQRNNGASYWICSTAGSVGASEPAWANNTAGTTQADSTVTWTCLGVVGNFTGGQAPHARLPSACTLNWFAAGNTVYVGDNHAESQATAITIAPPGSTATLAKILCHNHSGGYPPASADLATGATISTTAASANITFSQTASAYFYGITFKAGVGISSGSNSILNSANAGSYNCFDNCSFWLANSTASNASFIQLTNGSANGGNVVFNNTTVKFGVTTNVLDPGYGKFTWQNTGPILVSGSAVPVTLFNLGGASASQSCSIVLEAIDLSQITGNICNYSTNTSQNDITIKDCKLNAGASIPQPGNTTVAVQLVRSDSSGTAYKSARYQYEGTETTETSVTRVGGAVDPSGQAQSRKIATTATSQWLKPFKAEPYAIWNPTTGANVTVTVYGTINAGTLPNNDDIWLEVEYLGASANPLGTIVTTTKATVLAANAAVASDASTWNGGGSGAGWSPFKLTATLSAPQPGMAGYLHARVRAAKPSATYYFDPKIVLS
jgi:hypothetical protein